MAVALMIFAATTAFTLYHHEIWLDEMQAWLLAKDTSLHELFALLHYEGHPGLWHLLLKFATVFSQSPVAMQMVHWLIATISAGLFLYHAPFSLVEKILLVFGYYHSYEYAVISRNYGLGWLFVITSLVLYDRNRYLAMGASLVALAHSHLFGCIIAVAFALGFAASKKGRQFAHELPRRAIVLYLIIFVGVTASLVSLYPNADIGLVTLFVDGRQKLVAFLNAVIGGVLPLMDQTYWFQSFLPIDLRLPVTMLVMLAIAYFFWSVLILKESTHALLFYFAATTGLLVFFYFFYSGQVRHHGYLFLAFLAGYWLKKSSEAMTNHSERETRGSIAFLLVLLTHFGAAIVAHVIDIGKPFSQAHKVAAFLAQEKFRDHLIVGDADYHATSIAGLSGRPIYSAKTGLPQTYVTWNLISARSVSASENIRFGQSLRDKSEMVLVVAGKIRATEYMTANLQILQSFEGAVVSSENFYVFELPRSHTIARKNH